MATAGDPISGGCFCGAVRFELDLPTLFCAHCHCSMCRRLHGAAFVTWFGVSYAQFRLVQGDAELTRFRSSEHGMRSFCRRCGSTLFCESTNHPEWIDIVLASLDRPIDRTPEMHIFVDDGVPWRSDDPGLRRLGGASGLEPR